MLSIIIPQYNKSAMTENCINSIIETTSIPYEIVLVDNGSTEIISDKHKKLVNYIRSDENILFSRGCNLGAKNSKYDNLCFLNNDTIPFYGWESAVNFLDDNIGIVGSKLLYPDGTIQHAGMEFISARVGEPFSLEHRFKNLPNNNIDANKDAICPAVTGACLFITKKDFNLIGNFDENFKNWFEDVDLCFKVRFQLNKKVLYSHKSKLIHLESATGREMNLTPMHVHSRNYFYSKWMSTFEKNKTNWL